MGAEASWKINSWIVKIWICDSNLIQTEGKKTCTTMWEVKAKLKPDGHLFSSIIFNKEYSEPLWPVSCIFLIFKSLRSMKVLATKNFFFSVCSTYYVLYRLPLKFCLTRLRPLPKFGQISSLKTDCSAQGWHRNLLNVSKSSQTDFPYVILIFN